MGSTTGLSRSRCGPCASHAQGSPAHSPSLSACAPAGRDHSAGGYQRGKGVADVCKHPTFNLLSETMSE